ncbi:MAG: sigma-54 dependent transcriptional regulator [Bacteroidales bacterium]|nr:sigma-54 dependent transcriptional regulator [Bacteroidales bacterium]
MEIQTVKQRFGITGNSDGLNRAIDLAMQVAPTDLSVLVTGESGVGKENIPRIIHQNSHRKHGEYIAVNCGAIPEGTIDSELFGHEKGSFTGATDNRKGYFEVANSGTIFLDEVAELPLSTQVRLLRVLESGEFMRVGSSKVQKTDVRVVAATNVNILDAIANNKFREDLYYRLNTVPISIPPLRNRQEDIYLLFRKFSIDFSDKYRMPTLKLDRNARELLENYRWPGNIRQLRNITEQMSIIEQAREISAETLARYIPGVEKSKLPALVKKADGNSQDFSSEREILYKVLFDMKNDMNDLKKLVFDMMKNDPNTAQKTEEENSAILHKLYKDEDIYKISSADENSTPPTGFHAKQEEIEDTEEFVEENLSLAEMEKEMISKALEKHRGKRKDAAQELGISERTLYRKIKEYNIEPA